MFGWLKKDPAAKLEREIIKKMTASIELQRNGKIKEFALATAEIEKMRDELDKLRPPKDS